MVRATRLDAGRMVFFGGDGLRGPESTGLVVGKVELIEGGA